MDYTRMNQRSTLSHTASKTVRNGVVRGVKRLAFWGSVLLPVAYIPVLSGAIGGDVLLTLVGLVALNLACLVIGHTYAR
jgi:hypothetical protein